MKRKSENTKEIQDMKVEEMIKRVRKDQKSEFNVFLSLELRDRFEERPLEEKHLNFDQWRKLLILRDENEELMKTNKEVFERMQQDAECRKKFTAPVKKNKMYFSEKDIKIPEFLKTLSTKKLLNLRYNYNYVDSEQVYAELANRPHILTNKNQRNEQKKRGPSKKDGAKKKSIRSHKSQGRGTARR